jgi:hypothetical protein
MDCNASSMKVWRPAKKDEAFAFLRLRLVKGHAPYPARREDERMDPDGSWLAYNQFGRARAA